MKKNISYFETLQVRLKVLFVCPPLAPLKLLLHPLSMVEGTVKKETINGGKQSRAGRKTRKKKQFFFCCHCGFMTMKLCPCNNLELRKV